MPEQRVGGWRAAAEKLEYVSSRLRPAESHHCLRIPSAELDDARLKGFELSCIWVVSQTHDLAFVGGRMVDRVRACANGRVLFALSFILRPITLPI